MATVQQISADLDVIKQNTVDYIAKRDAIDVDLKKQLADALAAAGVTAATQEQVDALFAKAEDDKALLQPPAFAPFPSGAFLNVAQFNAAVAAYQGPEKVTLDGVEVPRFKQGPDQVVDVPAVDAVPAVDPVPAVLDDQGNVVTPAVPGSPAVPAQPATTKTVPGDVTPIVGTEPALAFFSHSDKNGDIDSNGPTS